jgi:hypothetical protein
LSDSGIVYDGLEFKEQAILNRYVALKRRLTISTLVSFVTLAPAMALLVISYVSPSTVSPYLYLVFLGASIPSSVLSFRANSNLTDMMNSNEVRHVTFA